MIYYLGVVQTTGSPRLCSASCCTTTLYSGTDRDSDRVAHLASEVEDRGGSYGNPTIRTVIGEHESTG